jgi:hypothetical protein
VILLHRDSTVATGPLARAPSMNKPPMSPVHVIALVRGAVEGDPIRHLASLLGYKAHVDAAVRLRLVTIGADLYDLAVTEAGQRFYHQARLDALPDGRANHWRGELVEDAVARLGELDARPSSE